MRDETLKRNNIRRSDLDDSWVGRGSVNKLFGERDIMYRCPECGHRAFALTPTVGYYHCWACGIWGNIFSGATGSSAGSSAGSSSPSSGSSHSSGSSRSSPSSGPSPSSYTSSQLDDYVPLPLDVLEAIEDISLAAEVQGAQKAVRDYLSTQQISPEWARHARWGVCMHHIKLKDEDQGKQRPCLVFRNYVEGFCCNAKYRSVSTRTLGGGSNGTVRTVCEKGFDQDSSFTPCAPYNIDCLSHPGSAPVTLYITEGEKDCLTLQMLGFVHVISAAAGAQTDHQKSFEAFTEWLRQVSTVVIVGDQDAPGRMMTQNLIHYFDDKRVLVCRWDKRYMGKDITEVRLQKGDEAARQLVLSAEPVVREDIEDFATEDARSEVIESARGNYDHGYSTGIGPVTDSHFRLFSLGGLIIVTGTPNTGKTDFLNFLSMSLLAQRCSHVCFCSFETPNKRRHAGDLTQIWAGGTDLSSLTSDDIRPYAECVMNHVTHICMRREKPTPEAVLRKAEVVQMAHPGMEFLIIDPYLYLSMTQGRNITETDSIKAMLTTVQDWAHEHRVWVFIVAHPRKLQKDDGSKEMEEVDMYTIAGSANWANVADYVLSIKRIQQHDSQQRITADYTRLSVLKVRDQKISVPGDIYYNRQSSGRYDERASERDAVSGRGTQNLAPYPLY